LASPFKDSFSFQLRALIEQISFIEQQVKDTEREISRLMEKLGSPITTITGIGNVTGATIKAFLQHTASIEHHKPGTNMSSLFA
jgi:predicted DNA-binding ArsR family transcriptional regulator